MAKEMAGAHSVLTGVVLKKYRVLSYNKFSHILVIEGNDKCMQITKPDYDGSGFVELDF